MSLFPLFKCSMALLYQMFCSLQFSNDPQQISVNFIYLEACAFHYAFCMVRYLYVYFRYVANYFSITYYNVSKLHFSSQKNSVENNYTQSVFPISLLNLSYNYSNNDKK